MAIRLGFNGATIFRPSGGTWTPLEHYARPVDDLLVMLRSLNLIGKHEIFMHVDLNAYAKRNLKR